MTEVNPTQEKVVIDMRFTAEIPISMLSAADGGFYKELSKLFLRIAQTTSEHAVISHESADTENTKRHIIYLRGRVR